MRSSTAQTTVILLFGSLALVHACHDLVPAMPFDMGLGIIASIAVVIGLALLSDRGRRG